MFGSHAWRMSMATGAEADRLRLLLSASMVAVLFLGMTAPGQDCSDASLSMFEFACEFHTRIGRGQFQGLMASGKNRHRITLYWLEPRLLREAPAFLRYSDFIVVPEAAYYWVHGATRPGSVRLSDPEVSLLPQDDSVESIARSSLAIVGCIQSQNEAAPIRLEVGKFFQASRGQSKYTHPVLAQDADANDLAGDTTSDILLLNALPYWREYFKEVRSDRNVLWTARRAMNSKPIVTLRVTPLASVQGKNYSDVFDPNTLGHWAYVPEYYRTYWRFAEAYCELSDSGDARSRSSVLYDRIQSYLQHSDMPGQVRQGLNHLRFHIALRSDDPNRICRSAQTCIAGLCQNDSLDDYDRLFESAIICGEIEKQYPDHAGEWLPPLVELITKEMARDIGAHLDRLMPSLNANQWFTYAELMLKEVQNRGLTDEHTVNAMSIRLEAARISQTSQPLDPSESSASVRYYMAHLDDAPREGTLHMNDVRGILEEAFAKAHAQGDAEMKRKVIEDVLRSIRLIAGEGPFCGDQTKLIESIGRFSEVYLVVHKTGESIETVLATFMALSFCDISTPEDHDVLSSQFLACSNKIQSEMNEMLSERGLTLLIGPSDVNGVFNTYRLIFRTYVDDPLWPAFKFPWTGNEEAKLVAKLRLRLMEMEPVLDEILLKVRHGGMSTELKEKVLYEISRAAQKLLPEAAFLRSPPYPGVSCQYRGGGYGFTAMIRGPLYQEGNRPQKIFQAMKYFHLGHRLQGVVEREREFMKFPQDFAGMRGQ